VKPRASQPTPIDLPPGVNVHDVGGRAGYGAPVLQKSDASAAGLSGSAFAQRWEASVFTMMLALGGAGVMKNTDQFRHAIERIDADAYFNHGYYGRWLGALETLLLEAGELNRATLDARVGELAKALDATQQQIDELVAEQNIASRPLYGDDIEKLPQSVNAASSVRYMAQPPKFKLGQRVVAVGYAANANSAREAANSEEPFRHTRLPAYARGAVGEIIAWHRGWVLPDTNAHTGLEEPAHLYGVAFQSQVLYGADAEAGVVVHLDLFEPYLESAEAAQGAG